MKNHTYIYTIILLFFLFGKSMFGQNLAVPECEVTVDVSDFIIGDVTENSIRVGWLALAHNETGERVNTSGTIIYGYKGFNRLNASEHLGTVVTLSNDNSWTFENLEANTEYDFYLNLVCQDDSSIWTKTTGKTLEESSSCTTIPISDGQGGVLANGMTPTTVRLFWGSGVDSTLPIMIAYGKSGVFDLSNENTYTTTITPANINEFYINGLEASTSYVFYIKAECQNESLYVGPTEATTLSDSTNINIDIEAIKATPGTSFRPMYEKKYVLSGWVKEKNTNGEQQSAYKNSAIRLYTLALEGGKLSDPVPIGDYYPKGNVIDGWQRIEEVFVIKTPNGGDITPNNLIIELVNNSSETTSYFDDVRIFPFNASMKSFVYDNETKKLMAELDENNYATYYEYDKEGGLVRVKKETSKGVYTIQETRSSNAKSK